MGAEKAGQILGQELHDRREVGEHADMAAHALRVLGQFDGDFFDIEKRDAGMVQQRLARRVSTMPFESRSNRVTPNASSKSAIRLLTADAAMASRDAARVRICSSPT